MYDRIDHIPWNVSCSLATSPPYAPAWRQYRAARIGGQGRFSFARPAENPRRYWAGWQFRISRGWLHRDLQELQNLFLLGCWEAILIEFSAIDRDAIARDLR